MASKGKGTPVGKGSKSIGEVKISLPKGYVCRQGGLLSGMRMTLKTESAAGKVSFSKKGTKHCERWP